MKISEKINKKIKFYSNNKVETLNKKLSDVGDKLTEYELFLLYKENLDDVICPNCNGNYFVSLSNTYSYNKEYHCQQCGMMYEIINKYTILKHNGNNIICGINHGIKNLYLDLSINRSWKINKLHKKINKLL